MIAVDSVTIGFAVVGAVYVGHRFAMITRRAFYKFVDAFRPDFVYIVRREDDGLSFRAFYSSSDAGRFCLDSPERLTYYGVRTK